MRPWSIDIYNLIWKNNWRALYMWKCSRDFSTELPRNYWEFWFGYELHVLKERLYIFIKQSMQRPNETILLPAAAARGQLPSQRPVNCLSTSLRSTTLVTFLPTSPPPSPPTPCGTSEATTTHTLSTTWVSWRSWRGAGKRARSRVIWRKQGQPPGPTSWAWKVSLARGIFRWVCCQRLL